MAAMGLRAGEAGAQGFDEPTRGEGIAGSQQNDVFPQDLVLLGFKVLWGDVGDLMDGGWVGEDGADQALFPIVHV